MTEDQDDRHDIDDRDVRDAAWRLRQAASALPPPSSTMARADQRRRAGATIALVALAAVTTAAVVSTAAMRDTTQIVAGSAPGAVTPGTGTAPGTTIATATTTPGPTPRTVPTGSIATTATATATTAAPTTTDAPTPPVTPPPWVMAATYVGIEHYGFTERCPDITDRLDATAQLDDGSRWGYVADYCGTNGTDGMWYGAGTVELTAPDGAQLLGDFAHSTPVDTAGDPYTVHITHGTGRFNGATGSCDISVHIRKIQFAEQEQSGTLTCSITI